MSDCKTLGRFARASWILGLLGLLVTAILGGNLLDAGTVHASLSGALTADNSTGGQPTNMPCFMQGVVVGLPTTPTPAPTFGPPDPNATPTAAPTYGPPYYPPCQFPPAQSSDGCQGWKISLPWPLSDICIPWQRWVDDLLQSAAMGLGAAAQGVFNWVQGALTYTPDLTSYPDLASFYGSMRDLASALFVGFFMLAAIRYFLTSIGGDSAYEAIGAMRRGVVGSILLQALDPLLHAWFAAINAIAQAINGAPQGSDVGTFAAQVLGLNSLIVGTAGLLAPEVLTAAILLAVVFLLLITAITVIRLTGLFVLACLYVVAPACLVTWISPEFKGIARWWFASFVTYSLWGIAYALVLKVDVILLTTNGGPPNDGTATGKAVIAALMGLAGLVALWRVPRIMDSLLGGLSSSSAGTTLLSSAAARYVAGRIGQ